MIIFLCEIEKDPDQLRNGVVPRTEIGSTVCPQKNMEL
jgi:hypothetical protein